MVVHFPGAEWLPLTKRGTVGPKRAVTVGVILHIAGGRSRSIWGVFNAPGKIKSSNLYAREDGTVEQYMDMDATGWSTRRKSLTTISVESQGDGTKPWTPAQCETLAQIIAWGHVTYGYPLRLMRASYPGEQGIGWHRLGCPTWPRIAMPKPLETWGPTGKTCPGPKCIAQIPGILERAKAIVATGEAKPPVVVPVPAPKPSAPAKDPKAALNLPAIPILRTLRNGCQGADVKRLQLRCCELAHYWGVPAAKVAVDGDFGPATENAVKFLQAKARTLKPKGIPVYAGPVDGIVGKGTLAAFSLDRTY